MHEIKTYSDDQYGIRTIKLDKNINIAYGTTIGRNGNNCESGIFKNPITRKIIDNVSVHITAEIKLNTGIGTVERETNILTLENGLSTKFDNLYTIDNDLGVTFWNNYDESICKIQENLFIIYQGTATKISMYDPDLNETRKYYSIINEKDHLNFLITQGQSFKLCNENAFRTQSIELFVIESSNNIFQIKEDKIKNYKNLDTNLMLSMKIHHIELNIGDQMNLMYKKIMVDKCHSDSKIIENMISIARVNPQDFGFMYFKEFGISAAVRSEVIVLSKCAPVEVEHNTIPLCFNELPVTYNNQLMFMVPKSKILISVGERIECSSILGNYFFINNKWYRRVNGSLLDTDDPIQIRATPDSIWKFSTLNNVDSGIYSKHDVENLRRAMTRSLNLQSETNNFINSMRTDNENIADDHINILNSLKTHHVEQLSNDIKESLVDHLAASFSFIWKFVAFILLVLLSLKLITSFCGFCGTRLARHCTTKILMNSKHPDTTDNSEGSPEI